MDKVITLIIIVVAVDILYHYVRREQKGCDGSCRDCSIRRVCDKDIKKDD